MATPRKKKVAPPVWQHHPKGGQYITYKAYLIVRHNRSYSVKIGGSGFSVASLSEGKKLIDIFSRSRQNPPFEWQFHDPEEGWYQATYMMGAIRKDKYGKYSYSTDHKRFTKVKDFEDAKAKVAAFTKKWMEQFGK